MNALTLGLVLAAGLQVVPREDLLEAMKASRGYELTATTNSARFQGEVLLFLAARAQERNPQGEALFVGHEAWLGAYLDRTGLPPGKVPVFLRLSHQHGQDIVVEYRRERVIASARGAQPRVATNILTSWPDRPGAAPSYSYEDLLSTPSLRVTQKRHITDRLLDYGDMMAFDEIEGLHGRPTSGLLGLLFRLIGEGQVVESRTAISRDGLQVTRGRSSKAFFEVSSTITVWPDGRAEKDLPPNRPDLAALEQRLQRPLDLQYRPLPR